MANIRKSFNFRSGLQVDNDNFVINANGLVGIGTSVPQTYLLNVYGDTRTTGLTTTRDLYAQNAEISGIATVGFITATTSYIGILTVSQLKIGNGDVVNNLIGYARTTFITDNGGIGFHTTSKLGINTTTSPGASDPEFSVFGNVDVTGIVTATTFSGNVTGDVNSGISTFTELKVGTAITMSAGIITATTFSGSGANLTNLPTSVLTGTISTTQIADGAVTDAKIAAMSASKLTGTLPAISGASLTSVIAEGITGSPNVNLGITTTGNLTAENLTTGTIVGTGLSVTSIGVGTNSPTDALHIQQSGAAEIYVGSDSAASSLRVGRNLDDNTSGMVKYGNTSGLYPYSTENSLDFMNFGQGNVNFYVEAGIATTSSLNFNWIVGNNSPLMTLTDQGNLGIGITNPTHKLNVQGISTFTESAHFNESVTIDQDLTLGGNLTFGSGATITATFRGNLESADGSNTVVTVPTGSSDPVENAEVKARIVGGASTITKLDITGAGHSNPVFSVKASAGSADSVGSDIVINVNNAAANKFVVNSLGGVGIGTTNPVDSLDLKFAQRPAVFPNMTTAVISGLSTTGITTTSGSVVYNATTNKLQVYNGTSWIDLH